MLSAPLYPFIQIQFDLTLSQSYAICDNNAAYPFNSIRFDSAIYIKKARLRNSCFEITGWNWKSDVFSKKEWNNSSEHKFEAAVWDELTVRLSFLENNYVCVQNLNKKNSFYFYKNKYTLT